MKKTVSPFDVIIKTCRGNDYTLEDLLDILRDEGKEEFKEGIVEVRITAIIDHFDD